MLQYVNNIQSVTDENRTSFVFHFLQNEPVVDVSTGKITTISNTVASIVLDRTNFLSLAKIIINELQDGNMMDELTSTEE